MRYRLIATLSVLGFLAICAIGLTLFMRRGVLVVVHNSGARPMFDVQVQLGGATINLGDIKSSDLARDRLVPHADSDVLITFTDDTRTQQSIRLDLYITGGYGGRVDAEIKDGRLESTSDKTTVALY